MNTNTDSGWNEVGDRLGSLGLKLKYHAEQAAGAEGTTVNDALENIREAIEDAFAALRGVVTDPAIRDDVMSVANGVAQAISITLREGLKHPGSIVKRAAPTRKAAPAKKAASKKAAVAKKVAPAKKSVAAKKAAPAKKVATAKKAAAAKKSALTKKAASKKTAPAKKAASKKAAVAKKAASKKSAKR